MPDPLEIREGLTLAAKGAYDGLGARLIRIDSAWAADGVAIDGHFHYLAFRDGMPTVAEFVQFVYWHIIPYCIPRSVREELLERHRLTGDDRYIQELADRARHLFVSAKESQKTSGEPAEVALFMLIEAVLGAPQLVCKMHLKTSEQVPFHGSDSIHIGLGTGPDSVRLIWGESKLYQQLSTALDDICDSIVGFLDDSQNRSTRERDLDVIRDHLDIPAGPLRAALLNYFDPYSTRSNQREESFACLAGFDYSAYEQLLALPVDAREARFRELYQERISSAGELFAEKLKARALDHLTIHFFLIPFPSVAEVRERFFEHLGARA